MGDDWHHLLHSLLIGLVLSFLLAKLISFLTAFKHHNPPPRPPAPIITVPTPTPYRRHARRLSNLSEPASDGNMRRIDSLGNLSEVSSRFSDDLSVNAERGSATGSDFVLEDDLDAIIDDDDWEGIQTTELDNSFTAATAFVSASTSSAGLDKLPHKLPHDVQLQLYGLYKIATEGPCSVPAPPPFKRTARAKWNAWQKLGAMPPEDAMQKYIDTVTELFPSWKPEDGNSSESKGPMGSVLSTSVGEEGSGNELKMNDIHAFAKEGDVGKLLKCIESGVSVDLKDSEGRTPFHWAVDCGHLSIMEQLLIKKADVNAKDNEGQTPLHYAVVGDKEDVAEYLVKHNADAHVKDNNGASPASLCQKNWLCMRPVDSGLSNGN